MVKLLISWDIRDDKDQEYLEFVTSEFVPLLMKHGAISDAWLGVAGSAPQMIMGVIAEDGLELRTLLQSEEWRSARAGLGRFVENIRAWFPAKVQDPGGFQM